MLDTIQDVDSEEKELRDILQNAGVRRDVQFAAVDVGELAQVVITMMCPPDRC